MKVARDSGASNEGVVRKKLSSGEVSRIVKRAATEQGNVVQITKGQRKALKSKSV